MLGASGTMVYTHEMTHNSDGSIYFEGHGRREGEGPESFATGSVRVCNQMLAKKVSCSIASIREIKIRPHATIPMILLPDSPQQMLFATTCMESLMY